MKTLTKYHFCNHCEIGEKIFKNILIGPGKLPGLSRNGPLSLVPCPATRPLVCSELNDVASLATCNRYLK